jgi:hypothetical protein
VCSHDVVYDRSEWMNYLIIEEAEEHERERS